MMQRKFVDALVIGNPCYDAQLRKWTNWKPLRSLTRIYMEDTISIWEQMQQLIIGIVQRHERSPEASLMSLCGAGLGKDI